MTVIVIAAWVVLSTTFLVTVGLCRAASRPTPTPPEATDGHHH